MDIRESESSNNAKAVSKDINTLNKIAKEIDDTKYERNLELKDLFFAGYGFIIGAGIFTLMPFILKYSKGSSWLAFVVGGIICILTGLSYARLNLEYPTNDAEYSWIRGILKKEGDEEPNMLVEALAQGVIWIVMLIGLFNAATVLVGKANFINSYVSMNKNILTLILISIVTILNCVGNKYSTAFNRYIMCIVTAGFVLLFGIAGFKGKYFKELRIIPKVASNNISKGPISGLMQSSFITIFAFNGFQSLVQLSQEAKNPSDIPKGILSAIGATTGLYSLVAVSVVALLGVTFAKKSIFPISDSYGVLFGSKGRDFVTLISVVALMNTLMLIVLSRSRVLQKLAVEGIAPKIFKQLTSIKKIFSKNENFESEEVVADNEEVVADHIEINVKKEKTTLPINSIIAVSVATYLLTFVKDGALEGLANITNSFIFFVFILVNLLVLINYYKKKKHGKKDLENLPKILKKPWYAYLGLAVSVVYFGKSFSYSS